MNKDFLVRLRKRIAEQPPHIPGKRSEKLARYMLSIPEDQRTFLQRRALQTYEQGECIGCNRQGYPLGKDGNELPVVRESNGFAAPREYCDCLYGVRFRERIERERKGYAQQNIRERRAYAQRLFGASSFVTSPIPERTLDTWPVTFEQDETMDDEMYMSGIEQRKLIVEATREYVDKLYFEGPEGVRHGICLCGWPGIGKTGLISSIEPLLVERGHFMLSLFVPEVLRLLGRSEQAEEMLKALKTVEILFLDNLGNSLLVGPVSAEIHEIFACIFEERLKYNRPTLMTTNLNEDTLAVQFGEYILSRIHGLCYVYTVPGIDLR
jgi:DNA replication protein DnaC